MIDRVLMRKLSEKLFNEAEARRQSSIDYVNSTVSFAYLTASMVLLSIAVSIQETEKEIQNAG